MKLLTNLLSLALDYPSENQRSELDQAVRTWRSHRASQFVALSPEVQVQLDDALDRLLSADLMELQVAATELFDLGKGTSLRLFEHVHGDSRARGQAMVDLVDYYGAHGLELDAAELPDHLAVVLEAVSTFEQQAAKALLAEVGPVLELLCLNHAKQKSPWTACLHAVHELCGGSVKELAQLPVPEEEKVDIDQLWAEPEISFAAPNSCSTGVRS